MQMTEALAIALLGLSMSPMSTESMAHGVISAFTASNIVIAGIDSHRLRA